MKVFFWGVVVISLCYAAYAGMMSAYQWFQIRTVIEDVLEPRTLAELPTAGDVKKRILREATTAGVPLDDREVNVVATNAGLAIQVAWTFPVIVYKGESVLAVPLSVKKQHAAGGRAYLPRELALASAISFSTR
jgi:hypothetical protein